MHTVIKTEKPLFQGSTRPLIVRVNDKDIGYIKRWYRTEDVERRADPQDEVNISVFTFDYEIEIMQVRSSVIRGKSWEVRIDGRLIGRLTSSESLKEPASITFVETAIPSVGVEKNADQEAYVEVEGSQGGLTEKKGLLMRAVFETAVDELPDEVDPLLIAGIVHTYWLAE